MLGSFLPDDVDRRLIALLQLNAREPVARLARELGVARTTVLARMARLEQAGVITGYSVMLGQDALPQTIQAVVGLAVTPHAGSGVVKAMQRMPEVSALWSVSGEHDYLAWLRVGSTAQLDQLLDQIGALDGVVRTNSTIVLSQKIGRGRLPALAGST